MHIASGSKQSGLKAVRSEWFVEAVVSRLYNLVEVDGQAEY